MKTLRERLIRLFALDLRSLAAFRIGLGLLILLDLAMRAGSIEAHYGDLGALPRPALTEWFAESWRFSFHLINGSVFWQLLLFAISAGFALTLIAGYRTRASAIASWILMLSLQNRNPVVLSGADVLLRLLLFWGLFVPLGARWSLDSVRGDGWDGKPPALPPTRYFSAATVGLILQIACVYVFSGILKAREPSWQQGLGIYHALAVDQFATGLGIALKGHFALLRSLTPVVLAFEIYAPVLLLVPFFQPWIRAGLVLAFWGFHGSNALMLRLGLFPLVGFAAWWVLIPGWVWDRATWSREPAGPIAVDPSRIRQLAAALLAGLVLLLNLAGVQPKITLPESVKWTANFLRLDQCWNMFSRPILNDGWFVMPAKLDDGSEVDLMTDGGPLSWQKPESVSLMYESDRWRKFLFNLSNDDFQKHRQYYAYYLCRRWNATHPKSQALAMFKIYMMVETTMFNGGELSPRRAHLWRQDCYAGASEKWRGWDP
jgi:hypothetical protein